MTRGVAMDRTDGVLDEALERLAGTGPERDGWLSNHAPMAVEALSRHGQGTAVHRWIDRYRDRLSEAPRGLPLKELPEAVARGLARIHHDELREVVKRAASVGLASADSD